MREKKNRMRSPGPRAKQAVDVKPVGASPEVKTAVLVIASMSSFLMPFMSSSIAITIPTLGKDLHMDAILMGWVMTAYLLSAGMFLLPFGRLADIHGRKRMFMIGLSITTVSAFLCAIAPSALFLVAVRFFEGIGASMIFGVSVALITSVFPPGERGKALGMTVAAVYLGLSVGPLFGGFITQHIGWRYIFFSNIPIGLFMFSMVLWRLKGEWADAKGESFDIGGAVLFSLALVCIMYGFTEIPSMLGFVLVAVGSAGAVGFIRWEMRSDCPLLNIKMLQSNKVFAFSNLAALINYAATAAVAFLLSLYLQRIRGFDPQMAGLILIAQAVVQAVFSPIAGRLSDKIEPRIVASVGMSLNVVGLLLFVFITETTSIWFIVAGLVLLGSGFGLFSSPNTNAVMSSVEKRIYGVASATVGTMRILGQVLSMAIALLIFSIYIGKVDITPSNYSAFMTSMRTAFIIFSVMCMFGVVASLARGEMRPDAKDGPDRSDRPIKTLEEE